jgi:hypothetical protein
VDYTLHDCFMSGFAMMFFQDPSLLQFQLRLEKRFNRNNLKTLFDITDIPKDSQLRQVLALIKTFRPKSLCRSWRNNIRKRLSSSAGKEGFLING